MAALHMPDTSVQAPPQHLPRVFTAAFMGRLSQLNQAERALRELGLRVLWSEVGKHVPQVRVERNKDQTIKPLLEQMGPRAFVQSANGTLVSGLFHGVHVSWMEPV